ncbi:Plastocyanin-like [Macleaya cordata]|uniref:Plastocyanin-like n=1 Tax=Macleaya cordata TaxID=56857 RepID=A0A200QQ44_MACCD|nr:Plastocyanin-like [Macleaya cordata]
MATALKRSMVLVMMVTVVAAALLQVSMATVYKVGDSTGWTTIGNFDYQKWAASKTFRVGDIILFEYNTQFHNVMQVNHPDYQSCNTTGPLKTYTSGNDSITITRNGHYYYLCGVPGHCQSGQKVDIRVARLSKTTAPAPSTSPPSASPPAPESSPKNSAPLPSMGVLGKLVLVLAIFAGFGF